MSRLPIRGKLTLWYGAVLSAILILVSAAAYLRYSAAAWRAFDEDLRSNLDGVQGAFSEELREAAAEEAASKAPRVDVLTLARRAALATLEDFRLSGVDAEIRTGAEAQTFLARTGKGAAPLYDQPTWRRLARSGAVVLDAGETRRGAVRTLPASSDWPPFTLALARRTANLRATLAGIRRSLVGIGVAGVALALLGGYWLAARALSPIDSLTIQAGRLADVATRRPTHRLEVSNTSDELGRMAATFNRLLERIEADGTQRKNFVADAAHELKTPVAIVRAESELALSSPRSEEAYRESLRVVAGESTRLSRLVGDLTLLAEGQSLAHPLERRLVDLVELVDEVGRSLQPVAAGRGVRIETRGAPSAEYRGDERLLRQTLTNLIENAVKYSPPGGSVRIGVSEKSDFQEIRVVDAAPALSPEECDLVFDRFYRSPRARDEDSSGSGLGLAIVRWAVHLHGGRVRVEPATPAGNAFVVELPRPEVGAPS